MKLLFVCIITALSVFGQEAKIMIVEKSDSQRLAKAYRDYKEALKRWEETKTSVAKQYTQVEGKTQEGWEKVQFSADFRAIVPESSEYAARRSCSSWGYITPTTSSLNATGMFTVPYANATTSNDLAVTLDGVRTDIKTKE